MSGIKWWEWVALALFAAIFAWFLMLADEQTKECEQRGGVMVYKTGCIKAQRI